MRSVSVWTVLFENCTYYSSSSATPAFGALVSYYSGTTPPVTFTNMVIQNDSGTDLVMNGTGSPTFTPTACALEGSVYENITTTNVTITDSDNADPQMLDPANNDFRLKPASPAIDRGVLV